MAIRIRWKRERKKQTDNKNIVTLTTYDELDRISKTDYPTDTDIVYTYDGNSKLGTLTSVTDGSGSTQYTYDNRLRKLTEKVFLSASNWTTTFTYDSMDRVVTRKNPDNEIVTYAYNSQGAVNSLTGIVSNTDYNALGGETKRDYGNGLSTLLSYNTTDFRLNEITTGTLQDLNYTYDNVGNIKSIVNSITSKTQSFGYDDLYRLTSAAETSGYNQTFGYNKIGNLINFTDTGTTVAYTYGQNAGVHALTKSVATTDILGTTWNFTKGTGGGSVEKDKVIPSDTVAGATSVQVTFDLHGKTIGGGDDQCSIIFIQNGEWRVINLMDVTGSVNGYNGTQTIDIPIDMFHKIGNWNIKLDTNLPVTNLHARTWDPSAYNIDIYSVKVVYGPL